MNYRVVYTPPYMATIEEWVLCCVGVFRLFTLIAVITA